MATYTFIASVTVGGSGAQSMEFTNIPATYTDLLLRISGRNVADNYGGFPVRMNTNSTPFQGRWISGTGSTGAESGTSDEFYFTRSSSSANAFCSTDIYIPRYLSSDNKIISAEDASDSTSTGSYRFNDLFAYDIADTNAINKLAATIGSGFADKWTQYSSAYLYGISNA